MAIPIILSQTSRKQRMHITVTSLLSKPQTGAHRQLLSRITNKAIKAEQRIKLLQGFRQSMTTEIDQLSRLRKYYVERQQDKAARIKTPEVSEVSEYQLWLELDTIEEKIINSRDRKFDLDSVLEGYEDQLFEQQKLLEFRRQSLKKLKMQIDNKRMQVQKQQQAESSTMSGTSTPNAGGLGSPRYLSPRVLMSPRNFVRMMWK